MVPIDQPEGKPIDKYLRLPDFVIPTNIQERQSNRMTQNFLEHTKGNTYKKKTKKSIVTNQDRRQWLSLKKDGKILSKYNKDTHLKIRNQNTILRILVQSVNRKELLIKCYRIGGNRGNKDKFKEKNQVI